MLYRDYLKSKYQNTAAKLANAEGVPCVLEYSKGKNMRNYEIYANSVQDGTPTPEAPVEIQSVGNLTTKNLFNKEDSRCSEIKAEPPTVIDINTYAAAVLLTEKVVSLFKPDTTYTISCDIECVDVPSDDYTLANDILGFLIQSKATGYSSIGLTVKHQLVKGEIYHYSKTFTIPSNFSEGTYTMYVYRNSYKNSDGESLMASAIYRNIQIEEGSAVTEYEPYHKYDIPITVTGKNLFNRFISTNENIKNETVNTDTAYSIGVLSINKICEILKPNTTYTISCEFECESIPADTTLYMDLLGFSMYTTTSGYSTASAIIHKQLSAGEVYYYSQTFTTPSIFDSGGNYRFLLYRNAYNKDADGNYQYPSIICRNIQIEEASSATAYEPYKGSETTHIYLDEPLRKVGDYADYIDFKNQKVVRNVKELELNESIGFSVYKSGSFEGFTTYRKEMLSGNRDYGYCTHINNIPFDTKSRIWFGVGNNVIFMSFPDIYNQGETDDERKAAFYTFLLAQTEAGTPVKVIYILKTPTEETISLPALKTFKGTNVISVDTTVLPSNIKANYIRT